MKDGKGNLLYVWTFTKHAIRLGASSNFHQAAFNNIRRPQFSPDDSRALEESQQFWQILKQSYHKRRVRPPPASERMSLPLRLLAARCLIDRLGICHHRRMIPSPHGAQQVGKPVSPTTLMNDTG